MNCYDILIQEDWKRIAEKTPNIYDLRNKSVLVTGATGLVGVNIVRALMYLNDTTESNIKILAVVRSREKAESIYGETIKNIKLIIADITKELKIEDEIDYIIHAASITASKIMIEKPVETIITSVYGTKNLLELAIKKHVGSFVYISSMEMYGSFDNNRHKVTESMLGHIDVLKIRSNYPESKRLCENMCIAYLSEYNVPIKIARLAQTFGVGILPGENRVFAQFAKSIINGEDIVLHTKGKSEGNYCYISDAISGIITILLKGTNGEAYNVVNEETHTTIAEMAHMVSNEFGKGKTKVVFDIPASNTGYASDTKLQLSSDKLNTLGWSAEIGLKEMYKRLILSLEDQHKGQ